MIIVAEEMDLNSDKKQKMIELINKSADNEVVKEVIFL